MDAWLAAHPREGYGLLVLHTHPHGDHVAGDAQFTGRPDTVLVDADRDSAWDFYGFSGGSGRSGDLGDQGGSVDLGGSAVPPATVGLGGRVLECWPSGTRAARELALRGNVREKHCREMPTRRRAGPMWPWAFCRRPAVPHTGGQIRDFGK